MLRPSGPEAGKDTAPSILNVAYISGGRICIIDSDEHQADDLAQVLEAMGHEAMVIKEMIGASNRIRSFDPEILIIDAASTALPGEKLLDVLRRNLGDLPRVVFFTDMPRAEMRERGLADQECLPKSGGLLALVNRIRVILLYDRNSLPEREYRA